MTPRSEFSEHERCFVCGAANASGLKLTFEKAGRTIRCRTCLDARYQSYEGVVHGGILAAVVDAAMVHLVRREGGGRPRTCRLEVRYRAPVPVGEEITAEAAVTRARHGIVWAACSVRTRDRLCVEAKAAFRVDQA